MNAIGLGVAQPWMERLGWALLHFVWQGALIAGGFALLRGRLRGPLGRYLLGCAALAAMMAAPLATIGFTGRTALATLPSRTGAVPTATGAGAAFGTWEADVCSRVLPRVLVFWRPGVGLWTVRATGSWCGAAGRDR